MKKAYILFLCIAVLMLTSCMSMLFGTSDTEEDEELLMDSSPENIPLYNPEFTSSDYVSRITSSNFSNTVIKKSDRIMIYSITGDYFTNRSIETTLKADLIEQGFSDVFVFSDYMDVTSMENAESIYPYVFALGCTDVIQLEIDDNMHTYTYGGGIADIAFDIEVWDIPDSDIAIKIVDKLACKENKGVHFDESLANVIESMSMKVVKELCKYSE